MRLLHIYAGNLFGGIETLLITLAKENKNATVPDLSHDFALCFEGRLAEELREVGGCQVKMLGQVKLSRFWTVLKARRNLRRLLEQEKYDVVICHSCWPQIIFGPVVKAERIPLIFWCHDTPKGTHLLEKLAKRVSPNLVLANTVFTLESVPKLYPEINVKLLYYPVLSHSNDWQPELQRSLIRKQLNVRPDTAVIIQTSRLERWKGQTLLLSALGRLKDIDNWVCWLAGGVQRPHEQEYLQELKQQAQQLGIGDRLIFLGQRSDVPQLLAGADIHCQPNTGPEPFGITFIEALYAGLPVVTTAMGGALEIVDESCGYLVPPGDVQQLADTLAKLIADPQLRANLGNGGKARADLLCNPQQQLNKLYQLSLSLIRREVAP